jgi:hypothetical protein
MWIGGRAICDWAERNGERIPVEAQSFLGDSAIENLQHAIGQNVLYRILLDKIVPTRLLYMRYPKLCRQVF